MVTEKRSAKSLLELKLGPAISKTSKRHKDYDQLVIPEVINPACTYECIEFSIANYQYVEERVSKTAFNQFKGHVTKENHLQILNGTFQYLDSAIRRVLKEWSKKGIIKKFNMITIRKNSYNFSAIPLDAQLQVVNEMKMISMDIYNPSAYDNQVVSFKCLLELKYIEALMLELIPQVPNRISEGNFLANQRAIKKPYYFVDTFEFDVACSREKPWVRFVSNQNFKPKNTYPLESNLTNKEKKLYYKNYLTTAEKKALKKKEKEMKFFNKEQKEKQINKQTSYSGKRTILIMNNSNEKTKKESKCSFSNPRNHLYVGFQSKENTKIETEFSITNSKVSNKNVDVKDQNYSIQKEINIFQDNSDFNFFNELNTYNFLSETDDNRQIIMETTADNEMNKLWNPNFDFIFPKFTGSPSNLSNGYNAALFDDIEFNQSEQECKNTGFNPLAKYSVKKRKVDGCQPNSFFSIQKRPEQDANESCIDFAILLEGDIATFRSNNPSQVDQEYLSDTLSLRFGVTDEENTMVPNVSSVMLAMDTQMSNSSDFDYEFNLDV